MTDTVLSAKDRRYLSRRRCAWCDQRLDRKSCGAIFMHCEISFKQEACLAQWAGRPNPPSASPEG